MLCPHCGTENNNSSMRCTSCNTLLVTSESTQQELYKACIGSRNQTYYLKQFDRFDVNGGKFALSWNWSTCFFTFYWLLDQKMWLHAFIYCLWPFYLFFLLIGLDTIGVPIDKFYPSIFFALMFFIFTMPAISANFLYYKNCNKKINAITTTDDLEIQKATLISQNRNGRIIAMISGLLVTSFYAAVIILTPGGCGPTTRSYVSEGLLVASSVRTEIAEAYADTGNMPPNYVSKEKSRYVSSVVWHRHDQNTGIIIVMLSSDKNLKDAANTSIFLKAKGDPTTRSVKFICSKGSIPVKYLPSSCQN